jgi:hypothetical protein
VAGNLRDRSEAQLKASARINPAPPAPPPPPPPKPREDVQRLFPAVHATAFYAGGANLGWGAGLTASFLAPLPGERAAFELEVHFVTLQLSTQIPGLGLLDSRVLGGGIDLAARLRALERGPWAVDVRLGGGVLGFTHTATSSFQPSFFEDGAGPEGFAAAQAAYQLGPAEIFLELRGSLSPVSTPRLKAQLGGIMLSLGGRFSKR